MIKDLAKNISTTQKKIFIVAFVGSVFFLLFWFLVYLPAKAKISHLKKELSIMDAKIQSIEETLNRSGTFANGVKLLKEKHQRLTSKFPLKEEEGLKLVSDLARKMNVEIISTKIGTKESFSEEEGRGFINMDGKKCQKFVLTIDASSTYEDLVKYLENLNKSLSFFIQRISISKGTTTNNKLRITLDLSLYLLS